MAVGMLFCSRSGYIGLSFPDDLMNSEDHPKACIEGLPTPVSDHCLVIIWSAYLKALHLFNLRISG